MSIGRRRLDEETRCELDAHIELLTERFIRSGMNPADARFAARRQFGNVTALREELRMMHGIGWIEGLGQDVRYALRRLRHSAGFSAVVIGTLALGIGGTTAVFSVIRAVLLAPLPYEEPGQLVRLYQQEPGKADDRHYLAGTHFSWLREHASSFEEAAALGNYSERGLDLMIDGQAQRLRVLRVTSGYFRTLRSSPPRGRDVERQDEAGARVVVLSDRIWRTRFHGDPALIGTTVRLSAEPYEIAGIASPGFEDPIAGDVDAWVPYNLVGDTNEESNSLTAIGRLRNGVSLEQARAELATLSPLLKERWPAASQSAIVALPLREDLVATARAPLYLLFASVGLVLLLVCVNVANLVLVRTIGRVPELAIQAALGSGRARLVRQLFVESLVLAGIGGVLGLALARVGVDVLKRLGRDAFPRLDEVGFDPAVLAFAVLVSVGTAVVFGIAPALRFTRVSPIRALRQQSRSATGSRAQGRLRGGLAAAQLALALTLLVGAGVLLASVWRLQQVNPGFRVERVLTFEVNLPSARYNEKRRAAFQEEMARAIEAIPGVTAAGGISRLPATGSFHPWNTRILSGPLAGTSVNRGKGFNIQQRTISGNFFGALAIPLLAGRTFDARDEAGAPMRAVVSASFARQAFPGIPFDGVAGQRIAAGGSTYEIIGIVGDVALDVYGTPTLAVYRAHRQYADNRNWMLTQVAATELPPERVLAAVRTRVAALDPELVVHRAAPMTDIIERGTSRERFALFLMGTFAVMALLLASLGLYGVLAYDVRQRTQEIGIRMALGSTAAQVRLLILRQAAVMLGIGLAVGLVGALVLGRWLTTIAFGISPWDPRIFLATTMLLTMTGLAATWLPARRASRLEPRVAMQ